MSSTTLTPSSNPQERLLALHTQGMKASEIAEDELLKETLLAGRVNQLSRTRKVYDLLAAATGKPKAALPSATQTQGTPATDKKVGELDWRKLGQEADRMIKVREAASWSQDHAKWALPEATRPIAFLALGDLQVGSAGTLHKLIEQITDDILSIPDLYVFLVGDLQQMAIKMRGVTEMMDNVLTPELQDAYLESWLAELAPRVVSATWDNHSAMRQEEAGGASIYKRILSRSVVYHSGIGHVDVTVGQETYQVAVSHFFRGRSKFNPCHAPMCYLRETAHDREIAVQGDTHVPGIIKYTEGGAVKMAANCGTTQLNSGYAKRFCSLKTFDVFPVFTLDPAEHMFTPYWSVKELLRARGE